jgi:hypothetical protein
MNELMAKKNTQPKSVKNRPHKGKNLNVWVEDRIRDALDAACIKNGRKINKETAIALEFYLVHQGLLPARE